ncbi:conserved hypothetical protein [Gammaproteobacteria bacterium]
MTYKINDLFLALPEQEFPTRISSEISRFTQQDPFFHLAAQKNQRSQNLRNHFVGKRPKNIYISSDLRGFDYQRAGFAVRLFETEYLPSMDDARLAALSAQMADSVVIINNNGVGRPGCSHNYAKLYDQCDKTIFVVWDWDNHHWLSNSTFAAAHSDIYVPAHHENLYLMSRYNWCVAGPVYCATIQWPRAFLADHVGIIANMNRSNDPLGKHIVYPEFSFRNRVVMTLSQHYPSVGFSTPNFHDRTLEERMNEWVAHKAHWIMPVLNDVPIRIFDALATGGIPLVPESLRMLPPVNQISRDHILFYTPNDIVSPERLINKAVEMFDKGGLDKLMERHRYSLDHHHASVRINQILQFVEEKFEILLDVLTV